MPLADDYKGSRHRHGPMTAGGSSACRWPAIRIVGADGFPLRQPALDVDSRLPARAFGLGAYSGSRESCLCLATAESLRLHQLQGNHSIERTARVVNWPYVLKKALAPVDNHINGGKHRSGCT